MLDLKKLADRRYRITMDESWEPTGDAADRLHYYQIPCRHGHIYPHSPEYLGVYVDGNRKAKKIEAIPGIKIHQRGTDEATFLFTPDLLDVVAAEMKAKKRRQLSPERRAALVAAGSQFAFPKPRASEPENDPRIDDQD